MKVFHILDFFSPNGGGTVDVVGKLSRASARKGHKVVVNTNNFKLDLRVT
jgi:hypothetical protein